MNQLKEEAFKLRKQNKSYNYINRTLGIPKSTLSSWFKENILSSQIKELLIKKAQKRAIKQLKLMALANKQKWKKINEGYRKTARQQFPELISIPIFGVGLMLYWGEGDKVVKNGIVRIANTDYRILKLFIAFLIKACEINLSRIRIWLLLYPDLDEIKCKKFWSRKLRMSLKHFDKSQFIIGREKRRKVNYGVCSVQIYSREIKEKIVEWIDLYNENLERAGMV